MPIARFQLEDGRIARFEVPEGTTPEQAQAMIAQQLQRPQSAAPTRAEPGAMAVGVNAAWKGLAGVPDALLNTPNRVLNLGRAAVGTVAAAAGRPDLAPDLTDDPNYTARVLRSLGLIRDSAEPTTTGGRVLDTLVQGATGGLVSPANSLPAWAGMAALGAGTAGAGHAVHAMTGNDAAAISASLLVPGAAANAAAAARRARPMPAGARVLRDAIGNDADVLAAQQRLSAPGGELVPGSAPMTHQLAQLPQLSQLTRTVENIVPGNIAMRRQDQNAARLDQLDRIAPGALGMTPIEAATNAGAVLARQAAPLRSASNARVSNLYEGVDPFQQSQLALPITQAEQAMGRYFGPGAGAPPGELAALLGDLKTLGSVQVPPAVPPHIADIVRNGAPRPSASRTIDFDRDPLSVAVRKLGGLDLAESGLPGELRGVLANGGKTPSVVHGPLARRSGGRSADEMADLMYQRGYIDEPSGALLLEKLTEDVRGSPVWSMNMSEDALAATRGAYRDMPESMLQPQSLPGTVPFTTLQNLRSRASEAAYKLGQTGDRRAAAVANEVKRAIDAQVQQTAERAAAGQRQPGEYFEPDMAKALLDARRAKVEHEARFGTGPSGLLWKDGADGAPRLQGGEAFRAFFNPGAAQAADVAQLNRMMAGDAPTLDAFRQAAVSDLAGRAVAPNSGLLSNHAFQQWTKARGEALRGLLADDQRGLLNSIGADLERAARADSLGRAIGSNTAQNLEGGLLFSRPLDWAARLIPVVGKDGVEALRNAQRRRVAKQVEGLLLDPELAAAALGPRQAMQMQPLTMPPIGALSLMPGLLGALGQ